MSLLVVVDLTTGSLLVVVDFTTGNSDWPIIGPEANEIIIIVIVDLLIVTYILYGLFQLAHLTKEKQL